MQVRGGFSDGIEMWDQGFFLASEQGQKTPKFMGRERVVGSRCFVCQVLEQRQEPACFSAGNPVWAQEYLSRSCPRAGASLVQCRAREAGSGVCVGAGLRQEGRDIDGAQEYVLGDRTRARPRLVQCRTEMELQEYFLGQEPSHIHFADQVAAPRCFPGD